MAVASHTTEITSEVPSEDVGDAAIGDALDSDGELGASSVSKENGYTFHLGTSKKVCSFCFRRFNEYVKPRRVRGMSCTWCDQYGCRMKLLDFKDR